MSLWLSVPVRSKLQFYPSFLICTYLSTTEQKDRSFQVFVLIQFESKKAKNYLKQIIRKKSADCLSIEKKLYTLKVKMQQECNL